jgi:tetratricopeptide (TPR) repeat protein
MKHYQIRLLLSLIFILPFSLVQAAFVDYNAQLNEGQKHLSCLRLQQANTIFKAEIAIHPANIAAHFLLHYSNFYHIMVQQDKKLLEEFEKSTAATLLKIQELPESSPYRLFYKGSVHLQSALIKGAFNEYLSSAWDFRTAYQEINQNESKFPSFLGHKKELGVLMSLIGTFPKQYMWVVNVVGLEGDFEKGMGILTHYINNYANEPLIEKQESLVYYTLIQLNFGSNKNLAWEFYKDKCKDYEQNLIQCYMRAYVAGKCGENEIALQTLKNRPNESTYEQIHYLDFLMGEYLIHQLDFSAAIWYKKYLTFSATKSSYKEAYQKLAWISWLQSDTSKFITYIGLMEKNTKEPSSEAKLLRNDIKVGIYPSTDLIKARLLFDGGYLIRSNQILLNLSTHSLKSNFQLLDWKYRQARIFQEQGKFADAIVSYKKCLEFGVGINSYLLPNSCLQLGLIYEELKYPKVAKLYYEKVSDYSNFDYEQSINQKAKAGIMRVKK